MNYSTSASFGGYETARILIPGFYFASLCTFFFYVFVSDYVPNPFEHAYFILEFLFLVLVSGLTMYAKETTKRRRAFLENQPSAFLQEMTRRYPTTQPLQENEARQLYFYILNHYVPSVFHEKVFFFGTVYHIMIQIRRTSFWFAVISIIGIAIQTAMGFSFIAQQELIFFCVFVCVIYLLNVTYNKADRKMQENYQDQIFWLQMNESLLKELLQKYELSKKGSAS